MDAPFGSCGAQTLISGPSAGALIAPWVINGAIDGDALQAYVAQVLVPKLEPGTVVTAIIAVDEATFLVGNREIAEDGDELDVYSEASPLGAAILGKRIGETASYEAPSGATIDVEIKDVQTYRG